MKIIVKNEQEKQLIQSLCDVALKAGGLNNYNQIGLILASITQEPVEEENGKTK